MNSAECIGCGACVAACPNGAAMLFTGAKISHLALLPQGQPERARRALGMLRAMGAKRGQVFSLIEFTQFVESSSGTDPCRAAMRSFLPPIEEWKAIRPHLVDGDEIWTMVTSPMMLGFVVVRNDMPLCLVYAEHFG